MRNQSRFSFLFKWLNSDGFCILMGLTLLVIMMGACSQNGAGATDKNRNKDNNFRPSSPTNDHPWIRIIVHLNVAGLDQMQQEAATSKNHSTAKVLDQKIAQQIAIVADQVLKQVEPTGATLVRRYETLPMMALRVPPEALPILKSMTEVRSIEIDQRIRPTQ